MRALQLTARWPVPNVAAAVLLPDGSVATIGDTSRTFRIASIAKMLVGWTLLVADEEGTLALDTPAGQPGCTVRHLMAHAGGYAFDGPDPIAKPGVRRIYSNTGIDLAAAALADAAQMPYGDYFAEALLHPLQLRNTTLKGSPAHAVISTVDDMLVFVRETVAPKLLSPASADAFRSVQFAGLPGVVPGVGRYEDCVWGLGTELRGLKQPHWTGANNSPATFGHFGGAGTLLWVDPGAHTALIALTDLPFDDWSADALRLWPELSDAVLAEVAG
ncbi:MAG TPA: serine hydrolase domain-containing protein [Ilumatobacteraceae bacterium]|nr:serine hydrolase domain-containing protein [Ilumatobacteraceae bacterium]